MEEKIIELFTHKKKLKFNEIEKLLKIRSNKLNYHLKKLLKKGVLIKENNFYSLSSSSEYLIPYISKKNPILPIILIHIGNDKEAFLIKRTKLPYLGKLGLPGGRIVLGESIKESVKRILKEKYGIKAKLNKINSVSLEHIKKNNKIIHSFFLIYATAHAKVTLMNLEENKKNIIKSDYKIIKKDFHKKIDIANINSYLFD